MQKRRGSCALGLTHLHRAYADTVGISKKIVARRDYRTLDVRHAAVLERDILDAVIDPCGVCYDMHHEIMNRNENECQAQ